MPGRIYKLILIVDNFITMTTSLKKSLQAYLCQREEIPSLAKISSIPPSFPHSGGFAEAKEKRSEGRFFKKCTLISVLLGIFIMGIFSVPGHSDSGWKITLKVSGGGLYDYCIAGVKDRATDGHDNAWDIPAPPVSLYSNYVNVYFPHPEWNHVFEKFRQDIRAPDLPEEWIFEVVSNISGNLTIQWPDIRNSIPDKEAVFIDIEGSGIETDMHADPGFVFANSAGYPRRFLLRISENGIHVPVPPENLQGKPTKNGKSILLHWTENKELDLAGYNVYRSITPGSGYQRINYSIIIKINYTDNEIVPGQTYYYVVTAVNEAGGESGYSNEVEVTATRGKAGKGK